MRFSEIKNKPLNKKKDLEDLYKLLKRYMSEIVEVNESELEDYLVALINSAPANKSKPNDPPADKSKPNDPFDKKAAEKTLSSEDFEKGLECAARSGFHTHNLKVPNANVSISGGVVAESREI